MVVHFGRSGGCGYDVIGKPSMTNGNSFATVGVVVHNVGAEPRINRKNIAKRTHLK